MDSVNNRLILNQVGGQQIVIHLPEKNSQRNWTHLEKSAKSIEPRSKSWLPRAIAVQLSMFENVTIGS